MPKGLEIVGCGVGVDRLGFCLLRRAIVGSHESDSVVGFKCVIDEKVL
jgi:hypothetical protein